MTSGFMTQFCLTGNPRQPFLHERYWHMLADQLVPLYREMAQRQLLGSRDCEIWHTGSFPTLLRYFSNNPIRNFGHKIWPGSAAQVPHTARQIPSETLDGINMKEILPLRDWLVSQIGSDSLNCTKRVTLVRREHNRTYQEHDALLQELLALKIPVDVVMLEAMTFAQQVQQMQKTNLLIAVHGGGCANVMFLSPGAHFIEIMPKSFRAGLYQQLARVVGVNSIQIEADQSIVSIIPPNIQRVIEEKGWPTPEQCRWRPETREIALFLRDVPIVSLDPKRVISFVRKAIEL